MRGWVSPRTPLAAVSFLTLSFAGPVPAEIIRGGGTRETDCWVALDVPASLDGGRSVRCRDGDPACDADGTRDGACTFASSVCLDVRHVADCTPKRISNLLLSVRGYTHPTVQIPIPELGTSRERCGELGAVTVPIRKRPRRNRFGKAVLRLRAITNQERTDRDTLKFTCYPGTPRCLESSFGGPSELDLTATGSGSDLDLGTTGAAHGFVVSARTSLSICLSSCDGSADSRCDVTDGVWSSGPPTPVLAGGVPLCLMTSFAGSGSIGDSADVQTGAVTVTPTLNAFLYPTDPAHLCPRCTGGGPGLAGTCDAGRFPGTPCVVEDVFTVGGVAYPVSRTCEPDGTPAFFYASVRLTTRSATLPEASCDPVMNECGTCIAGTCTGAACVQTRGEDCVDVKGGLGQACCANDSTRSCFMKPLTRDGVAVTPEPPWPDPGYPKTGGGTTLVGTACLPATGVAAVDKAIGLPGPVAVVLPVTQLWQR